MTFGASFLRIRPHVRLLTGGGYMFDNARKIAIAIAIAAGTLMTMTLAPIAQAQEPAATAATGTRSDPVRIDKDGFYICGWELMNDSERAGHKSQLYFNKERADRDQIRKAHCDNMRKRAKEKGVTLDE
ncbi:MAG TPA: hypothetical protein VK629_13160 [Steroidobacteraceae bacterium]|nr:hypothetical protein [Steroidobacteraceae bacterium]